jgi:hypothetical protein
MPHPQATTYCSVCLGAYVLMEDGRCGRCTLTDPPLPHVGGWTMGHEDANDEIAQEFKRAWEKFMRESDARLEGKINRDAAAAEWAATGEAGVRARWS